MAPHNAHEIASAPDRKAQRESFLASVLRERVEPLAAASLLHVPISTAYRWLKQARATADTPTAPVKLTARRARRMQLLPRILQVFHGTKSNGTCGADKVHSILRRDPEIVKEFGPVGRNLVADIMRQHDLRGAQSVRKPAKPSDYAPNIPNGKFREPGRKVIGADTLQIKCSDGWLYTGIQLDHDDHEIVGAAMSGKNDTEMTCQSLQEAARRLETKLDDPTVEVVGHADRGPTYNSKRYKRGLKRRRYTRSNSRKHTPTHNPYVENWNSLLRRELPRMVLAWSGKAVHRQPRRAVAKHVRRYIRFYNIDRPHSSLGYYSPHEFARLPRDAQEKIHARTQARRDRQRKRRHDAIQRAREAKLAPIVVALAMAAQPLVSVPLAMAA